jgi:2-haloacid dehalogenase
MSRDPPGRSAAGVLFDAYGTLFDVHSIASLAEEMFPGRGVALAALWREKQLDYTRLRTLSDRHVDFSAVTRDALVHSAARLGLALSEAGSLRLMAQYQRLEAFPDALPALQRLRAHGIALAILSNGTAQMLAGLIDAAGMSGLFAHVLSADRVRKFKTAPELYQLGVEAFGCPAPHLVFVSSNGWDACCATWFGYRTFWVNRAADPIEELGVTPDFEARSLTELARFLGAE